MEWLDHTAQWLRGLIAGQAWLQAWQPAIAEMPDWVLLGVAALAALMVALVVWLVLSKRRASRLPKGVAPAQRSRNVAERATPVAAHSSVAPKTATGPASSDASADRKSPAYLPPDDSEGDLRSVRVFVSSTFLDMQIERRVLAANTFRAIQAKYRTRGIEVYGVDLRWGISEEMQERGETLRALLTEIDRCRPYFIGLLGDRFGSVPRPGAGTDALKIEFPSIAGADGMSVTEMEIVHGVLSNPDSAAKAIFFERDPSWDWIATLSEADRARVTPESEEARTRLAGVKARIRSKARIEHYSQPQDIHQKVFDALDAMLDARFPENEAPAAGEQVARLHRAYARERRGLHVGAESYLHELDRWIGAEDEPVKLIVGASGSGKSTLIANWIQQWRTRHPKDIVFEHYLGASPDSADPPLILQRLWGFLDRTNDEIVPPPEGTDLSRFSDALGRRLANTVARLHSEGRRFLLALDGLDKLSSEQNLGWLPLSPGVRVLASALDGEAKESAINLGFVPLEIKPLGETERLAFVRGVLGGWRRELDPLHLAQLLQPSSRELAGSPLFLKTILEELRVSADHARLSTRLADYQGAQDLPDLFARVLSRIEDDCGRDFVAQTLRMIWASRAGLEETEIVELCKGTPLAWSTVRNAIGDNLRDLAGRFTFGHDYLRDAVAARYLPASIDRSKAHLAIADHFLDAEPSRSAEETPFQLRAAEEWDRLEAYLVNLERLSSLWHRGSPELIGLWLPLQQRGRSMEKLLADAMFRGMPEEIDLGKITPEQLADASILATFLFHAGARGYETRRIAEVAFHGAQGWLGEMHDATQNNAIALAALMQAQDDLAEAQKVLEWLLANQVRRSGPEHNDTLLTMNNLAGVLANRGDHAGAGALHERVLAARTRIFGEKHRLTIGSMCNVAQARSHANNEAGALELLERAVLLANRALDTNDPTRLSALSSLASALDHCGDQPRAVLLYKESLEAQRAALGVNHPDSLGTLHNLASLHYKIGYLNHSLEEFRIALPLFEEVVKGTAATMGPEHPMTLTSRTHLALVLHNCGDFVLARVMMEQVVEDYRRLRGPDAAETLRVAEAFREMREEQDSSFERALRSLTGNKN